MTVPWELAANAPGPLDILRAAGQQQLERVQLRSAMMADQRRQQEYARDDQSRDALSALVRAGLPYATNPAASPGMVGPGYSSASAGGGVPDQRANALMALARVNPERALKVQVDDRKALGDDLDLHSKVNNQAIRLLGGVTDQASYDDAKHRAAALYGRLGLHIDEFKLPEQYDPAVVDGLMRSALDLNQQITQRRADQRFAWDVKDDEADNDRADRDVDDRIDDRAERRGLTAQGMRIASADRRRSQDLSSADRRRGQDVSSRDRARNAPVRVSTPAEASKLPPGTVFITPDGRRKVR